jgi:hypothetical protein
MAAPWDAERELWRTVLLQQFIDATWQPGKATVIEIEPGHRIRFSGAATGSLGGNAAATRDEARAWLQRDGLDFALVCRMAGFDAGYVRRKVAELVARNWEPLPLSRPAPIAA